jgi:hypothetical protein
MGQILHWLFIFADASAFQPAHHEIQDLFASQCVAQTAGTQGAIPAAK